MPDLKSEIVKSSAQTLSNSVKEKKHEEQFSKDDVLLGKNFWKHLKQGFLYSDRNILDEIKEKGEEDERLGRSVWFDHEGNEYDCFND